MEVNDNAGAAAAPENAERKRVRSEIEFPYSDLEHSIEIAQTLHSKAGTSSEIEEIAAWMNQSAAGGTFRTRVSAARMFGLIETAQGRATLTQLGRDILAGSGQEKHAAVTAFLNVELFRVMYEAHKGNILPPPAAIERQMDQLGVSSKQKERARQTFTKSAQFAGFIDPTSGRFIKPGNGQPKNDPPPKDDPRGRKGEGGGGGGGDGLGLDPLLLELLKKIPPSDSAAGWPEAQRLRWFKTFAMNVSQIYDNDVSPIELAITVVKPDLFS